MEDHQRSPKLKPNLAGKDSGNVQSWWEVPSIAHFCSLFRAAFNLLDFDIEDLEEALLTDGADDTGSCLLQDLIVRLLAGCLGHSPNNTDISPFNYQMFLRRFLRQKCQEQFRENPFNTDIDFQFLPLRTKVQIIHTLCDFRLDADDVQDVLKNLESDSLRVDPLGHDANSSAYYYFYGTRLYREDVPKTANKNRGKVKRRKLKQEKVKKKRGKGGKKGQEAEDEDNDESDHEATPEQGTGTWQVICYTEEDWGKLAGQLKGSTVKEEKALYRVLAEDFLPEIPRLFAEKERLQRKRMAEFMPRRQSSRIEKLAKEKEESARIMAKEEEERKIKENEERERRQRQLEEEILKERAAGRTFHGTTRLSSRSCSSRSESEEESTGSKPVGRQTNNSLSSATGKIHISSSKKKMRSSQVFKATTEDIKTGMFKVLEQLKNHEDAWPFLDEVSEDYAPRYYSVIRKPMDLNRMGDKLDDGSYTSVSLFRADFMRIIDNCRVYNGDGSEYTEMAMNLLERFEKCMERYVGSGFSSDEEVAVEFPSEERQRKKHRHRRHDRRHSHHSSQSDSSRDQSKHRSKERKKEPDKKKKVYADDEEEEDEDDDNSSHVTRNDSDWDQSRDIRFKTNHKKSQIFARITEHDKHRKLKNDDERLDNVNDDSRDGDQEWKDENLSDQSRSRDSSCSGNRHGNKRKKEDIRRLAAHKKRINDEAKDADKPEKAGEKRGAIRSERSKDGSTKNKTEPLTWEEQQRRDRAWSELVGSGDDKDEREDQKKDIFDLDLDDAGWEGLKQGLKEWKREKNQQKKPEKISDSKRMKRMSQEEEDRWFEEKETIHHDIKVVDADPFAALEREMSSNETFRRKHKERVELEQNMEDKSQKPAPPQPKKGVGVLKNPAIHHALSSATEEILKDLMWLDEVPRGSEFSSASSSPSQCLGDDQDSQKSLTNSKDEKEKDTSGKRKTPGGSTKSKEGKDTVKDGANAAPKRRTTERLQPGKSKGNLIASIQGETATTKEGRTASEWNKLTAPKLSLGTVLTSGFGVGVGLVKRHNFSDNSAESTPKDGGSSPNDAETEDDKEKAYLAAQKKALLEATLRREREEAEERERREKEEEELERQRKKLKEEEEERKKLKEEELEEEKELKPKQKPNPTPNLSAWFKAFGAPKSQPTTSAVVRRKPELSATLDITRADASPAQDSLGSDTPYRRDDLEDVPMTPGRRQRKLSTGSSVSEKSSFSQEQNDGCSPSYPAPFPSPLHRSPEAHRPMQAYPTNVESTIRVGFYQDTTYKSPDKSSSSPRDGPGPESHTYMHPHQASPHQAGTGSGSNYHQPLYPPYSPAPYTPSELHAGRAGGSSAASKHEPQPCSPSPAPSPAAAAVASPSPAHQDARSPSHLQIDLQSPHTSHPVEARSPMHAESPVDTHARSPLDSRLHIDTRSPIHAGSPMEAESPRLHIDARSPLDSHVRSPMDGHVRSPMHSQSPAEHRSPLHAGSSPLEPRLQIDSRSPMHAGSPMDSRSPLHTGSPMDSRSPLHGGSPMHVGSPMDSRSPLHAGSSPHESRLHIDTRSPLHSGSPMDSRSPIESRSPMHVDSRSPMDQRLQIDTRSPSHSGSPSHAMGSPTGHPHPMATAHGSPKESQSYAHHYHQQSQQALAQQAHAQHAQQAHAQHAQQAHAQHAQQAHAQHAQQAHAQHAQHAQQAHAQHAQQAHAQHAQQARAYPQQYQDPYLTSRGVAAAQPGPYRPTPHASPAPVYPHQLHHKHLLQQTLIKQQQEKEQQLFQQQQLQQEKEQQIIMQKLQQEKEQQIIMQKLQQEKEQQLMMQKLQQEKEQQLMMQKLQQEKEQQIMMQKLQQEKEQQLMMQKIQQEKQNQMLQLQQMQKLQQEKQNQETQQQMYMQRQHEQQIHQQLLAQQHQQYQSQQYAAQHQPQQSQQQLLAQQQQRSRTPVSSFPVKKRHYAEASFASTVSNFPAPSSVTPATTSTVSSTPTTSVSGSASSVPPSGLPLSRSPFTSGVPVGVPVGGARSPFTPVSEVAPRSGRSPFTPVTSAGAGVGAGPGSAALHQHLSHMMDVYPRPYYPPNPGAGALPGSLGSPLFGRPSSVHGSAFKESQPSSAPAAPPAAPVYPTKGQVAAAAAAAAAAHSPPVPVVTTPKQEAKNRQKAAKASEAAAAAAAAAAEASSAPAAAGAGGTAFQHYGLKGHPAAPGQAQVDVSKVPAVLPGSAFNFGPTSGLGLYPDKDSYSAYPGAAAAAAAAAGYYGHRPPAAADGADVTVPTAASFPFLSHQPHQAHQAQRAHQAAASAYPPVHGLAQALMDPAAYQQYLLHQGLYPGSYHHPAALGLRPPYDSMQRPPWL